MSRPTVLFSCNQRVRENYLAPEDIGRLESFAEWSWFDCEGGGIETTNKDPDVIEALQKRLGEVDALIVCQGSPTVDEEMLEAAPNLKIVGELEGDRFASRLDLDALWRRNVRTVDTTNGSSYPVAEWALALILIAVRNGGHYYRRIILGDSTSDRQALETGAGAISGKRVGLIGCGHMGRRLIKLLKPFGPSAVWVHDPYLARELAEVGEFVQTSLKHVLSGCDIVVCLAPLTPRTRRMIGYEELELIRSGCTLVNVSRGPIIDPDALIARLKRGDITAGLDVFDPEPIPSNSEITTLSNVFLSPHIGWYKPDAAKDFFSLMVDDFQRFFSGHETWFDLTPRTRDNRQGS